MLSIAIVTGEAPVNTVPESPVPIVNAFARIAVTVPDDPRGIVTPLTVIELFTSDPLAIFVRVLVDPLIDLFVNVVVPAAVTTGEPFDVSDVNAPVDGMVAPIGTLSIVHPPSIVTPLIVPPVIDTELLFSADMVPKPVISELGTVATAVNAEVPLPFT